MDEWMDGWRDVPLRRFTSFICPVSDRFLLTRFNILCLCALLQILPQVLPQVQSELSEECREPAGHAQIPGESILHAVFLGGVDREARRRMHTHAARSDI